MICEARQVVEHTKQFSQIISHNLGRQLVENDLLDPEHLEFNQCVLSLAIHRQARATHVSSDRSRAQLKSNKLKRFQSRDALASAQRIPIRVDSNML